MLTGVPDKPIFLLGGGGHARVLIDLLRALGVVPAGIITHDAALLHQEVLGVRILSTDDGFDHSPHAAWLVCALGNVPNKHNSDLDKRREIIARYVSKGFHFPGIASPHAYVSPYAQIGTGVQILTRAVVHAGAQIGAHSIINTGAIAEHDTVVGAHCHIAPAAVLCGHAVIGNACHIGAHATVLSGRAVPEASVVPAGHVVR